MNVNIKEEHYFFLLLSFKFHFTSKQVELFKAYFVYLKDSMAIKYEGHAVGIDLGTTYSCVAVWLEQKNRVEIIHNFTNDQRLVGVVLLRIKLLSTLKT